MATYPGVRENQAWGPPNSGQHDEDFESLKSSNDFRRLTELG